MRILACLIALALPQSGLADVVVPVQTIRAKSVITEADLLIRPNQMIGAISDPSEIVGMEARISLYAGRPIRPGDLRTPAVIERNQLVKLTYQTGSLTIVAEARALDRASPGELIKVMNLSSRTTLTARVLPDGSLKVE